MKNPGLRFLLCFIIVLLTLTTVISCSQKTATITATATSTATSTVQSTSVTTTTTTATQTSVATTTTKTTPTSTAATTTAAPSGPEYGGIMRFISANFPRTPGYIPEHGPGDDVFNVMEKLNQWDKDGNLVPILAESWESDPQALTITWHLRKGVKFSDGSDWNAEALRWNYQLRLDNNKLTDGKYVESLEVVDTHTLTMHLTGYTWLMFRNYGGNIMMSKEAFMNAGADDEARKAWARTNPVGTGAFKVIDFQRDTLYKLERNENYWREGLPYLDGVELRYIPDPMVAAAMMESKQADVWLETTIVQNIVDLQKKGFTINPSPGMFNALLFDSNDSSSPFADQRVRAAAEYAINRPVIAGMLGQGLYEPLHQMAASTAPSYVEGYDPRPYDPGKARSLIAEAGYTGGLDTTLMGLDTDRDALSAVQSNLRDVGINAELAIADRGKFYGEVFGAGWSGLVLCWSGIDPDGTELFAHFGPSPLTYKSNTIKKSPEFLAKCNEALDPKYKNAFEAIDIIKEAIKQGGEDAMIVPLWVTCSCTVLQPYVHMDHSLIHNSVWDLYDDWMENR